MKHILVVVAVVLGIFVFITSPVFALEPTLGNPTKENSVFPIISEKLNDKLIAEDTSSTKEDLPEKDETFASDKSAYFYVRNLWGKKLKYITLSHSSGKSTPTHKTWENLEYNTKTPDSLGISYNSSRDYWWVTFKTEDDQTYKSDGSSFYCNLKPSDNSGIAEVNGQTKKFRIIPKESGECKKSIVEF